MEDLKLESKSPSFPAASKKHRICLSTVSDRDVKSGAFMNWYAVDLPDQQKQQNSSTPPRDNHNNYKLHRSPAKMRIPNGAILAYDPPTANNIINIVYCVGGGKGAGCADVVRVDLRDGSRRNLPPMTAKRSRGDALVLDGKLFVFGGNDFLKDENPNRYPWAECYDLINDGHDWRPLKEPPTGLTNRSSGSIFALPYGTHGGHIQILLSPVRATSRFFIYTVSSDAWLTYDINITHVSHRARAIGSVSLKFYPWRPILVDDGSTKTLYWLGVDRIYAFEMESGHLYKDSTRSISGAFHLTHYYDKSSPILHLGGTEFCLFSTKLNYPPHAFSSSSDEDEKQRRVGGIGSRSQPGFLPLYCTRFRVVKSSDCRHLDVTVHSRDLIKSFPAKDLAHILEAKSI